GAASRSGVCDLNFVLCLSLRSFTARSRGSCAGKVCSAENIDHLHTSCDSLRQLIVWSHDHSRDCGFIPNLKSILSGRAEESVTVVWTCAGGHSYSWEMLASRKGAEEGAGEQKQARPAAPNPGRSRRRVLSTLPANGKRTRLRAEKGSQDVSSDEREKEPSAAREEGAQAKEDGESATGHAGTSPAALTEDKPEAQEEAERPTQVAEGEGKAGENSSVERSSPEKPAPDPRLRPTSVEEEQEEAPPQRAETPGRLHRNSKKPGPVSAELEKADSLELVCEPESEGKAKQAGEPRVKEEEEEGSQESEEQVAETELLLTR
ncbi:brain acid soluble protein 1-like, partial [Heptranchias perlo]|uniref:brain acid soluble protein 1-like n=1 Tax=Heptranchias perlo TaxID=212740 RepID=UPI00355A1067